MKRLFSIAIAAFAAALTLSSCMASKEADPDFWHPQVGHEPPECGAARQGPHPDSGEPQLREVRTQSLVNYGTESE